MGGVKFGWEERRIQKGKMPAGVRSTVFPIGEAGKVCSAQSRPTKKEGPRVDC